MKSHVFLLSCSIGLIVSCSCPPGKDLGSITLTNESREFFPYDGTETLVFVDEQGTSFSFHPTNPKPAEDTFEVEAGCICAPGFWGPRSLYHYTSDRLKVHYQADSLGIGFGLDAHVDILSSTVIESCEPPEDVEEYEAQLVLFDELEVFLGYDKSDYQAMQLLTSTRSESLLEDSIVIRNHYWENLPQLIGDTVISGNLFESVFQSPDISIAYMPDSVRTFPQARVYFNEDKGIVALWEENLGVMVLDSVIR